MEDYPGTSMQNMSSFGHVVWKRCRLKENIYDSQDKGEKGSECTTNLNWENMKVRLLLHE